MKTYKHLFDKLCSWDNLYDAYVKARRHKSRNPRVIEFEKHWQLHLATLAREIRTRTYKPKPLRKFILRDPKTRMICVSDFRDRVVHHALINILQPIFEPRFIHDSYASRVGKGTLPSLKRFDDFKRKASKNNTHHAYVLKADIRHYFETVDHDILLSIIAKRVKDTSVLWLARTILDNNPYETLGKGMPLGNWTSQFFANVYLNELDQFVKHKLGVKYYIRYVDDFIILHPHKTTLQEYEQKIKTFLQDLKLELHPHKCAITSLHRGFSFLGYRCFYHHKLVRQRNQRKIHNKLKDLLALYATRVVDAATVLSSIYGWNAYAMHANTFHLRQRLMMVVEQELIWRTPARHA
jgi:retron-type reverse transcriptase